MRLAAGNARFRGAEPFAALYAGHQFGTFVPQLGDGRAIALGEFENGAGDALRVAAQGRGDHRVLALRRRARRAALDDPRVSGERSAGGARRSDHARARDAGSDEPVFREKVETAAVLSRVAPSHVRFGSFEAFHYRGKFESVALLADYTIARFFPELENAAKDERYARFLQAVVERTGRLFARWQAAGFAHGVLNTDNMSILGLTLDYGPYGFLDEYDPAFVCNHSDTEGRYSFERQATIGLWNCHALAAALGSLVPRTEAEGVLAAYEPAFRGLLLELLRAKFGLAEARDEDAELLAEGLDALAAGKVDYTVFFRRLSSLTRESTPGDDALAELFSNREQWYAWQRRYRERLAHEARGDAERRLGMLAVNPKFVLRNHLAQAAIERAEERDYSELERLHGILRAPFEEQPQNEPYAQPPPPSARRIEVSCSS